MKSSSPDISNPLSRSKKRNDNCCRNFALLVCLLLVLAVLFPRLPRRLVRMGASTSFSSVESSNSVLSPNNAGGNSRLILETSHGDIVIKLRPDLSAESVQHIQALAKSGCEKCRFYRSETNPPLLLQGIMKPKDTTIPRPVKGACPPEYQSVLVDNNCENNPHHRKDPAKCACHGPTMTKGMVGWAAGETGPDFFINVFHRPVNWWGQQHTVWGEVENVDLILNDLFKLPTRKQGQLFMLLQPLEFKLKLE